MPLGRFPELGKSLCHGHSFSSDDLEHAPDLREYKVLGNDMKWDSYFAAG